MAVWPSVPLDLIILEVPPAGRTGIAQSCVGSGAGVGTNDGGMTLRQDDEGQDPRLGSSISGGETPSGAPAPAHLASESEEDAPAAVAGADGFDVVSSGFRTAVDTARRQADGEVGFAGFTEDGEPEGDDLPEAGPRASHGEGEHHHHRHHHHHHHGRRKVVRIVLAVVLVAIGSAALAAGLFINSIEQRISLDQGEKERLERQEGFASYERSANEPFYVLVLGLDAEEDGVRSRSDVMILARVDLEQGKVSLVSIPRDTRVELKNVGTQKINAAYAFGGTADAVGAVSKLADGIEISHVVTVRFEGFEALVDQLGGVWVDVPVASRTIEAGPQLMDGKTALVFARERKSFERGDYQRMDDQRILVKAIADKVLSESPAQVPGTISALADCVTTDLTVPDVVGYVLEVQNAGGLTLYEATVPTTSQMIDGSSYEIVDEQAWQSMLERFEAGEDPAVPAVSGSE